MLENTTIIIIAILVVLMMISIIIFNKMVSKKARNTISGLGLSKIAFYEEKVKYKHSYCTAFQINVEQNNEDTEKTFFSSSFKTHIDNICKKSHVKLFEIDEMTYILLRKKDSKLRSVNFFTNIFDEIRSFNKIHFKIHMGIISSSNLSSDPKEVLDMVLSTMRKSRVEGESNYKYLNLDSSTDYIKEYNVEIHNNKGVKPYFQPIFDVKTKNMVGAEVFSRWDRSNELEYPDSFIPIALKKNLVQILDNVILDNAAKTSNEIASKIKRPFFTVVRLMGDSANSQLPTRIVNTIKQNRSNLNNFVFEIKYSDLRDKQFAMIAQQLVKHKLTISVDIDEMADIDILSRIQKVVPFKFAKIDYVHYRGVNIEEVLRYLDNNKIKVLAFKIEDKDVFEKVNTERVDYVQGFMFSKPISSKELINNIDNMVIKSE